MEARARDILCTEAQALYTEALCLPMKGLGLHAEALCRRAEVFSRPLKSLGLCAGRHATPRHTTRYAPLTVLNQLDRQPRPNHLPQPAPVYSLSTFLSHSFPSPNGMRQLIPC